MHRTRTARAIALPGRNDDVQPTAILVSLGLIAALLTAWASLIL